jgi:pimeloyl-ACP methyl ester carboxylesterase
MRDLLLTLGYPRASILVHSLGGGVALQSACQFSERTERIVLISSGGLGAEGTPILFGRSDARMLADVLRGLTHDHQRRPFLRTARTVIDWRGQTVSAGRRLGLLSQVPLLVAWGANDKTIPPQHHHALADRARHAVTVEIADAGHYPHETAPTQLLSALQTFLAATRPFRYVEDRWVRLLTSADPVDARRVAARSMSGHVSSFDGLVRH